MWIDELLSTQGVLPLTRAGRVYWTPFIKLAWCQRTRTKNGRQITAATKLKMAEILLIKHLALVHLQCQKQSLTFPGLL